MAVHSQCRLPGTNELIPANIPLGKNGVTVHVARPMQSERESEPSVSRVESIMSSNADPYEPTSTLASFRASSRLKSPQCAKTWLKIGAITGLLALFLALSSIVASLVVLVVSDGSRTKNWKFNPSVYIGIATAVANQAIRYASVQGFVIAWWVRAVKGTTVSRMYYDWSSSVSLWGALRAGRNIRLLGMACILSTLVIIDGPLLQSASSVQQALITDEVVTLNVHLSPEIPTGYTGSYQRLNISLNGVCDSSFGDEVPTPDGGTTPNNICVNQPSEAMVVTIAGLANIVKVSGVVSGFSGTCDAQLEGPALATSLCSSRLLPLDLTHEPPLDEPTYINTETMLRHTNYIGYLGLIHDDSGSEKMNLISAFADLNETCSGTLKFTVCNLVSAIGLYDVTISDGEVQLVNPVRPKILTIANNTRSGPQTDESTLAGLVDYYDSNHAALYQTLRFRPDLSTQSGPSLQFQEPATNLSCPSFRDPMDDALSTLNGMMFRLGAHAAATENSTYLRNNLDPGLEWDTTAVGKLNELHSIFRTDYLYFVAAALVEVICVAFILPTYWGWWRVSRCVSLSPLDIGKAFDAPLLSACKADMSGRQIAKVMESHPMRYDSTRDVFIS